MKLSLMDRVEPWMKPRDIAEVKLASIGYTLMENNDLTETATGNLVGTAVEFRWLYPHSMEVTIKKHIPDPLNFIVADIKIKRL